LVVNIYYCEKNDCPYTLKDLDFVKVKKCEDFSIKLMGARVKDWDGCGDLFFIALTKQFS